MISAVKHILFITHCSFWSCSTRWFFLFHSYRFRHCRSPGTSCRVPITWACRISRGLGNSFYAISCISAGNLAIEVHLGSVDTEWTTKHTCFDGILIERIARLYKALNGFYWDNSCTMFPEPHAMVYGPYSTTLGPSCILKYLFCSFHDSLVGNYASGLLRNPPPVTPNKS